MNRSYIVDTQVLICSLLVEYSISGHKINPPSVLHWAAECKLLNIVSLTTPSMLRNSPERLPSAENSQIAETARSME